MQALLPTLGERVADVRRIAVLRPNAIGDFVVAVPALEALRAAYPDAEITYLGTTWHAEFLDGRPGPWDEVLVVPPYPGVREQAGADPGSAEVHEFFERERAKHYDLAIQMNGGGANSNPFTRRLGARVSAGSRDHDAPALDRTVPYGRYQHETLRFLEVASLVGAQPVTLEPRLVVDAADRTGADAALPGDGQPLVAVHPGANDPRRRWPATSFAVVADALADLGAHVVVVGTAADAAAAERLAAAMRHPVTDLTGRLGLGATLGVLARCVLLVGNDSGPRHLAAAVGTATIAIYWCPNLLNAGPLTRSRHRVAVSFRTSCPICGVDQSGRRCAHDVSFVADIGPDEVVREALQGYAAETAADARLRAGAMKLAP
jgi:ADP-heptose:LPS heptosyltransferase